MLLSLLFSAAAPTANLDSLTTPTGSRYEATPEGIVRHEDGGPKLLESLVDFERVNGLAAHPGGTVLIATDAGLLVTSDEVDVVDRGPSGDGSPREEWLGVGVKDASRIWFLTESKFGCIDARQGFARTIELDCEASPCSRRYEGMRVGAGGEVWVLTDGGEMIEYEPGAEERPRARVIAAGGERYRAKSVIDIASDGVLNLKLEGSGEGGVTFRYRRVGHHLWRALEFPTARIDGLEPGTHELQVCAFDEELRRSEPVKLTVHVPYPEEFAVGRLVPVALGGCLFVWIVMLGLAHRRGGGFAGARRATVTAFLACAIGLQVIAAIIPHGRGWPFVGFSMYSERYEENNVIYKMALEVVRPNGERAEIEPFNAGYGLFEFRQTLSERIHGGEGIKHDYLRWLRERHGEVAGYRILDHRWRLTKGGPIEIAPNVLSVYPDEVPLVARH